MQIVEWRAYINSEVICIEVMSTITQHRWSIVGAQWNETRTFHPRPKRQLVLCWRDRWCTVKRGRDISPEAETTTCSLLERYEWTHAPAASEKPNTLSLRRAVLTRSKARVKSIAASNTTSSLSTASRMSSTIEIRAVCVLCPFLNPHCRSSRRRLS